MMNRRRALMGMCGEPAPEPNGLVDGTYTNTGTNKWSISVTNNVCTQTNTVYYAAAASSRIVLPLKNEIDVKNGDTFSMLLRDGATLGSPGNGAEIQLCNSAVGKILTFGSTIRPTKNTKYPGTASADAVATCIVVIPKGASLTGTATFGFELYKGDDRIF